MERNEAWDASCAKLSGVHCGRLDLSSYDGATGAPERFLYCEQSKERTQVLGPFCDQFAYMAAMYPVLVAELKEARQEIGRLRRDAEESDAPCST